MTTLNLIGNKEQGAALPVALVMLLISTILGLTAIRSATYQQKISANIYDRAKSYQAAEAAMQAAIQLVTNTQETDQYCGGELTRTGNGNIPANTFSSQDCSNTNSADICPSIPPGTFTGSNVEWVTVDLDDLDENPAKPQYYIEHIGTGFTNAAALDAQSTDQSNYGIGYSQPSSVIYRVTARSSQPSEKSSRSIVALQTTISRACKFPVVKEKNNG